MLDDDYEWGLDTVLVILLVLAVIGFGIITVVGIMADVL